MLDTLDSRGDHLSVALAVQGEDDRLLQNDLLCLCLLYTPDAADE